MKINRDNYEEFFLLYSDNELNEAARREVEEFVEANRDLREEFLSFQQVKLLNDPIQFVRKDMLLRKEDGMTAMQENLMLLLDGELNSADAEKMNSIISSEPLVNKEWAILQQTRLNQEAIVYPDKASLYRRQRNVYPLRYWVAAAAIVTGVIFFGREAFINDSMNSQPIAKEKVEGISGNKNSSPAVENSTLPVTKELAESGDQPANKEQLPVKNNDSKNTTQTKQEPSSMATNIQKVPVKKDPGNDIKVVDLAQENNKNVNPPGEDPHPANREPVMAMTTPPVEKEGFSNSMIERNGNTASQVVYLETESNDHILFMDKEKVSRSKASGVFKKVKRVIVRNTNVITSEKLRIGSLEIAVR